MLEPRRNLKGDDDEGDDQVGKCSWLMLRGFTLTLTINLYHHEKATATRAIGSGDKKPPLLATSRRAKPPKATESQPKPLNGAQRSSEGAGEGRGRNYCKQQ